ALPGQWHTGAPVRIALLGIGNVGRAVLARLATWPGGDGAPVELAYLADSRRAYCPERAIDRPMALEPVGPPRSLDGLLPVHGLRAPCVIVDATASDAVAAQHARWLASGVHVVTACKLGQGAGLARWRDIRAGCATGGTYYGDRATVGAGLPLLETLRSLQAGGDRIHAMAGVLSGSLAWLLDRYDGRRPFSALVEEARLAGLTEPDPREDLSGADVRRKLLILARAAGVALDERDVGVVPLATALRGRSDDALQVKLDDARSRDARLQFVGRLHCRDGRWHARAGVEALEIDDPLAAGLTEPDPRDDLSGADVRRKLLILARAAGVPLEEGDVAVTSLPEPSAAGDAAMQARLEDARRRDARLQFVGRLHRVDGHWQAQAGLEALPADDPLAAGRGTDNRVAIWSDRYRGRPLLIQGPGAGAGITAAALLDDVLGIARAAAASGVTATPMPARAPAWVPA
ncbi:MAG TPA: hypothetical protein VFM73_01570, partial [Xanthomonadaceae bacterium]|nr:hypothetical protein [Xanthomonadaceae bacterium]